MLKCYKSKRVTRLAQGRPTVRPGGRLSSLPPLIPSLSSTRRLKKTAKEIIVLHFLFQLYCYSSHQLKKKKKVEVWFLKIRMESAGVEILLLCSFTPRELLKSEVLQLGNLGRTCTHGYI